MKRTEYFNDTMPGETQLNNTEDTKIEAILERMRSSSQMGIVSGFEITVNAGDATKIDISAGTGYTGGKYEQNEYSGDGSGERIHSVTAIVTAQGLADYTNGENNYVTIVYAETSSDSLAERDFPYTAHDTIYSESYSVSVLDETSWAALTASQLNNRILVGIVSANGAGVALTSADITQVVQPKEHPTVGSQPDTLTGVTVGVLADSTSIGTATIRFVSATKQLYYTAPGDAEGSAVTITSSGSYTLYSSTASLTVIVSVVFGSLPAGDITDTFLVESLYGAEVPRFSAVDSVHRDFIGSGTPTPQNIHGISFDDIDGGTLDHADRFHVNGISVEADSDQLSCAIDALNDRIVITNNGGNNNSFLIDGLTYTLIDGVASGVDAYVPFDPVSDTSGDYLIYLDSSGAQKKVQVAAGTQPVIGGAFTGLSILDMRVESAGSCTLDFTTGSVYSVTFTSPGDSAGDVVYLSNRYPLTNREEYYKIYSNNGVDWIVIGVSNIGVANYDTTFTTALNETDYPVESILKLALVHWNQTTEILSDLRDIRQFTTSDTTEILLNEHDADGNHTKPFKNKLEVATDSYAVLARAHSGGYAVFGSADSYGVAGYGSASVGVMGYGDVKGVSATAVYSIGLAAEAPTYGVSASAENTAIYGTADSSIGIYGEAFTGTGVYGSAVLSQGVVGIADGIYGVYGDAAQAGVYGTASSAGVLGAASTYGVKGEANESFGVHGVASTYGVVGLASVSYGVSGSAGETGVAGYGFAVGVQGKANYWGVYGSAVSAGVVAEAGSYGVSASVLDDRALVGTAVSSYGVSAKAGVTGVYGSGVTSYGVYGSASQYGVYGSASQHGVYGAAVGSMLGDVTGLVGTGFNSQVPANAIGVYGEAYGYGVSGYGTHMGGKFVGQSYGGLVSGSVAGLTCVGEGSTGGYVWGGVFEATNSSVVTAEVGVYGSAQSGTGVKGYGGALGGSFGAQATGLQVSALITGGIIDGGNIAAQFRNTLGWSAALVNKSANSYGYGIPIVVSTPGGLLGTYVIPLYSTQP